MWVPIKKKNVILALNYYLILFNPPLQIPQVAYWKSKNLSLNSATFFLTKSYWISLETSWLLKFEIWCVSISINCNFSWYLNQVSHRNNQPLPFFNFLTWSLVSFFQYPSTDIYQYPSDKTSWSLTHELYSKWYLICKLHTFFPWAKWCYLLSPFVKCYHWT